MQVCLDPRKGLSDEYLEIAKSQQDNSFFEDWFGVSASSFALVAGMVIAGASVVGYSVIKNKRWKIEKNILIKV